MGAKRTIVQELVAAEEAGVPARFAVRGTVRVGRHPAIVIGLDNGNDALKLAGLTPDGRLVTLRIPTAYRVAEVIRGGAGEVSYRVDGAPPFWIGETALRHDGDDLPIGPTHQRVTDPRLPQVIAAGIADLLHQAGYEPGVYPILLGFAIPNTEIVPVPGDGEEDRLGVTPETRDVLQRHITGTSWVVERTAMDGTVTRWTLNILSVVPQAQTTGTVVVVTKAPTGTTVTDIESMDIIDIGSGDLQLTTVQIRPTYQMTTRRLGEGTIRVARALKDLFPQHELNDVAAQQALITRHLLVSGRMRDISPQVEQVINSHGQAIIGAVLPVLRQSRRFVTMTGGGVILLHDLLTTRLAADAKIAGEDYYVVNHRLASVANSIGVLFATLFMAAAATKRGS